MYPSECIDLRCIRCDNYFLIFMVNDCNDNKLNNTYLLLSANINMELYIINYFITITVRNKNNCSPIKKKKEKRFHQFV